MTDLLHRISDLLGAADRDLDAIEHTLTDGYAHALTLEAERFRLERRAAEVTQDIERGDTAKKARELSEIVQRLDGNADDLVRLRSLLADLRRRADDVRVGSTRV
jgi:hypothetical protein